MNELILKAQQALNPLFSELDEIEAINTQRVLDAFQEERISSQHFAPSLGYGYDDIGRDSYERVLSRIFGCEAALARPSIASGTHALAVALFGVLRPGDTMLSVTGKPYDTLEEVIGISGDDDASLKCYNIAYKQVELKDGHMDIPSIIDALSDKSIKLVTMQRSCGYEVRPTLTIEDIEKAAKAIKEVRPDVDIMVDNCYGEFTDIKEPTMVGADMMCGSMIKNPGGGIAPTGGYIAGKKRLIDKCATRLTCPGIGAEVGSYAASYQPFFQGLFLAPHVVMQAVRGAMLCAAVFEDMGYTVYPPSTQKRSDIIQAIVLGSGEKLCAFCRAVQAASPVEGYVVPEPWDMPGYTHQVIMAAGTFIQGASIELSADGPMREPYAAYLQGGLTYTHVKLALERIINELKAIEE